MVNITDNSNLPFISVVIPVFNGEETIAQAIESLLKQSYPSDKYEILIVDNMSTDTTSDIVKKYSVESKNQVKYLQQTLRGVSHARNLGIEKAQGEYILFTDDDCVVDKDWILNTVNIFAEFKADAIQGKIVLATEIPSSVWFPLDFIQTRMAHVDHSKVPFIMEKEDLVGANMAVKSDVFKKNGGFSPSTDFYLCEDTELTHRFRQNGVKCVYAPDAIVFHHYSLDRLKEENFLKQSYHWGKANVILEPNDMPASKYFLYCFRLVLSGWVNCFLKMLKGKKEDVFFTKCKIYSQWGRCVQILNGPRKVSV